MVFGLTGELKRKFTSGIEKNVAPVFKPLKAVARKIKQSKAKIIAYNSLIFRKSILSKGIKNETAKIPTRKTIKRTVNMNLTGLFIKSLILFLNDVKSKYVVAFIRFPLYVR